MNGTPTLQEEARKILGILEGTHVPPVGLDYFTVGDKFREDLLNLELSILDLTSQPTALERIVLGDFGTGKTHFLSYLEWLLERDAPKGSVISRVDLSDLRDPNELQYLIVQGIRPARGSNYAQVLRDAYIRIRDKYTAQYREVKQQDIERFYATVLFAILGKATGGWVGHEVLDLLGATGPLDRLIKFISGKNVQAMFDQARRQANKDHVGFVDTYLQMIRYPNSPISAFETPARELSSQGKLTTKFSRF